MILSNQQSARFTRLFNLLMDYVSIRYHDEHGDTSRMSDQAYASALIASVWGKDGDISIIDDFVDENPARINRTDQRAVLAWKNAAFEVFTVLFDGTDACFLYGEHAFAVRGITREIADQVLRIPAIVKTVLVPFDGLITYGTMLFDMSIEIGPTMRSNLEEDLASYKAAGKVIRTERQYARLFPVARAKAEEDARVAAEERERLAFDPDNDELAEGQHAGVLAELSWEEREETIKGVADRERHDTEESLVKDLAEVFKKGRPAATLEEFFSRFTRAELIEHARSYKMEGPLSKRRKADLVKTICAFHLAHPENALADALFFGASEVRFLSRLVEAKGILTIREEDVSGLNDLPAPIIPFMITYKDGQDYVVSMPQDLLAVFADIDLEKEVARAERIDRDFEFLLSQVDFWGVMTDDDITYFLQDRGYAERLNEADLFISTVVDRIGTGITNCERVRDVVTGMVFLVEENLFEELDVDEGNVLYGGDDLLFDILDRRADKPERLVYDMRPGESVVSHVREKDSYRRLCAFLDAHVPDGESDYYFAEDFADSLVLDSRFIESPAQVLELINDMGVILTEPQLQHLLQLMMDVMNDTPRWDNYGWSPNELRELGDGDR